MWQSFNGTHFEVGYQLGKYLLQGWRLARELVSVHPEMAIFTDFGVGLKF